MQGDSQGFLWFGTESGLNRLDRKPGKSLSYRHDPKNATAFLTAKSPQFARAGTGSYGLQPMAAASTALTLPGDDSSPTGTTRRTLAA